MTRRNSTYRPSLEILEDRVVPSWAGVPPASIIPPSSAVGVTLNSSGDAQGNASIASTEVDYYTFVAPVSGTYVIEAITPASNLDTVLGVFRSTGARLAYNDDVSSSNLDSRVSVSLTAGQRYYIGVTNYSGTPGGAYTWKIDGPAADDSYEQNDSFSAAYNLGTVTATRTISGLALNDSADWFKFTINSTGTSSSNVTINFLHSQGDLVLELYNSAGARLGYVDGYGNSEQLSLNGRAAGTYYVKVSGYLGARNPNYSLTINPPGGAAADDAYEENDSLATAYNLGAVTTAQTISGLALNDSADWFKFTTSSTGSSSSNVTINFLHSQGDLVLELYNSAGTQVGYADGYGNSEQLSLNGLAAGAYYVKVSGYLGALNPSYSLTINPPSASPPPPPPTGAFDIQLNVTGMTASQRAIFAQAAARWEEIIIGDVADAYYNGILVDDLLIDASGRSIDGSGGILGQAGPDSFRSSNALPIHGVMEFDTADLAAMEANGSLLGVILHEMGHVLGIGTLWSYLGLLTGAGTSDPRYIGTQGLQAYNQIFGTNSSGVPVENTGGQGTRDAHWRDSVFGVELMSAYAGSGSYFPISRVTVGSLADLGYQVNMNAADPFAP